MTSLLDVNVLIALAWPSHVHHRQASMWFAENASSGWATCPMTQCGFVRVSSNPSIISEAVSPGQALTHLKRILDLPHHVLWDETASLTDMKPLESLLLVGHRQVTDAYLLGLAIHHKGKLATLDQTLPNLLPESDPNRHRIETLPVA